MMKKFLFVVAALVFMANNGHCQDKQEAFDKKWRFGLRGALQPSWFTSNDNKIHPYGAKMGFGFGLNVEYHFSQIICLSSGIGADFEGGNYQYINDATNNYSVFYLQNSGGEFITPSNGSTSTEAYKGSTRYDMDSRTIKTTHVTIPILLKMSTKEYSGFKYFGMFGGEIGIRTKIVATDNFYYSYKFDNSGVVTNTVNGGVQDNINLGKDASLIPFRVGFNAGIGTEYRLGGSTSVFMSVNYFRSFTNLLKNQSKYLVYNIDTDSDGKNTYDFVKQNIIMNAIRINVGILF